jgi:glycine/D-amino acid oxidase-like deaminating enzyme
VTVEARADVVLLGAGLVGAAVARELAARGRRVVLLGTRDDALAPSLGHVLVGPGVPYRAAVLRFGRDRAREVWECQRENGDRLRGFVDGLRDSSGYRRAGGFLLAGDRDEGMLLADSEDLLREDGFPGEFLDQYMLEARFDLAGFAAAYWAADDAEVDAASLLVALLAAAAAQGAEIRPAEGVLAFPGAGEASLAFEAGPDGVLVRTARGPVRAPWAVLTTEAFTFGGAPPGGVRSSTLHGLTLRLPPGVALPSPARTADGAHAWQVAGDRLLLAGVGRPGAAADGPLAEGTAPSAARTEALPDFAHLRAMAERLHALPGSAVPWEAATGASPDGLPVIGLVSGRPLAVAVGLGTLAASYAFMAARWIAEAVISGRDPTPAAFRPDRPQDPQAL